MSIEDERIALVFAGGVGLGAYQAGAYAGLHAQGAARLDWIAASSVGAANAAVIAGNAPENRLERLRTLWMTRATAAGGPFSPSDTAVAWRHAYNWLRVVQTRLLGAPGHFHPRSLIPSSHGFRSLYDLAPLRAQLERLVDFGRLNSGEIRFAVATTDVVTGETVVFDTGKGDRIDVDHLLASAGYLPEFAPLDLGGRLLGDGGLSTNAPMEAVLLEDDPHPQARICFVVDLFARDGERPAGLEAALARKNDLLLANQTYNRLELLRRDIELRNQLTRLTDHVPADAREALDLTPQPRSRTRAIVYLSYRAPPEEAGPEKPFDLSSATARDRWRAGELDMAEALRQLGARAGVSTAACVLLPIRRSR